MHAAFSDLAPLSSKTTACRILGISRATQHRRGNPVTAESEMPAGQRAPHPAALSEQEREQVLDVLDSDRFADKSPAQAWAVLLDEGSYYCSIRTMYRVLESRNEVRERRAQAAHPPRVRPELVADGPDQVWTWDITKLKSRWRGLYFDLYVMMDIFSRKVVCQEVHVTENGDLAKAFIENAIAANGGARPDYIHADNGTSMTSKPVSQLLSDLNISDSHSRPHVSNDNPVFRGRVQDLEVLSGVSRELRVSRRCPHFQLAVLRLLQQRAPSFRNRPAYPAIRPRRNLAPNPGTPPTGPRRCFRGPARPVPRAPPGGPGPARQGLDQRAPADHPVTGDRRDKSSRLMSQRV